LKTWLWQGNNRRYDYRIAATCNGAEDGDPVVAKDATVTDFLSLSPQGQQQLLQGIQPLYLETPTSVIHKGQCVSGAYLVTRGRLRVFTFTPQGNEATLYFIRPGETCVLALNCLFNDLRYPAWVECDADTEVTFIPGSLYRQLFAQESAVQDMTVKALSTLVFRLMNELEQLHTFNLDQRLANFLLSHASEQGVVRMTQQTLAGHLGTSREVIARLMQGFSSQGLVTTGRGSITITDAKRLSELIAIPA